MNQPLIGITTYNQANRYGFPVAAVMHQYIRAVAEAGGAPVLIPSGIRVEMLGVLVERLDGFLFTGGGDIGPELYKEVLHESLDGVDRERDEVELALLKRLCVGGKPFLGICRGVQTINVALGGTLYTHLPEQLESKIKHNRDSGTEREVLAHTVQMRAGTRLAEILGEEVFEVNSLHHQGVKALAKGLVCAGTSADGLVEAVELAGHRFGVAVQWHPEWLMGTQGSQRLFGALIEAARNKTGA